MCATRFWNNLHQVRSNSKDWKANNLKAILSKKSTGREYSRQNRLWSLMSEGGES